MATICSCNNTTAASTHTSTPSSLASSTCGTNCHQTQWGLLRSHNSRTDLPPPRCIKSYYGPCFISTSPCTVFTSFTNVLYFYMNFISAHLLRIFYSWSKHKRICTVRQYSGSLAHSRGMYYNGKEGHPAGNCHHGATQDPVESFHRWPMLPVSRRAYVRSKYPSYGLEYWFHTCQPDMTKKSEIFRLGFWHRSHGHAASRQHCGEPHTVVEPTRTRQLTTFVNLLE